MDQNPSSYWEAILEKISEHIPNIESDSSSSESEETISIFQRPVGLSLEIPEDFSFSMDGGNLEAHVLCKPETQSNISDKDFSYSLKFDDDEIVNDGPTTQRTIQLCDADVEGEAWKRDSVLMNAAKLNASSKPYKNDQKAAECCPVLSFERLIQWDLDHILQNMSGDGMSLKQNVTEPVTSHADGDKNQSQESIMDKLVAFCKSQSSLSSSEPGKGSDLIRQKNVSNISSEKNLSHQECPTVYVDHCCPDSSIKLLKTSANILSEVKSPAKSNTHRGTAPAQTLKVQTASQVRSRDMTGKSKLLQTIRMMKNNENANQDIHTDSKAQSRGAKEPIEFTRHLSEHSKEEESSHTQNESVAPKRKHAKRNRSSKIKKQEQRRDQQEQHQQILKRLTKHCPTTSVNKKQPAAERTDVLYHVEASYLQPISTLPPNCESKGQMMLIVNLSSPGMVKEEGLLYPAATKSHIYNTLVAWFLSLVGPGLLNDEEELGVIVPFWVAGLQQLWTEDGLALYVLAVARGSYTPKKKQGDIHTSFYKHVCRFLSETTLPVIAHWLPQVQTLLDQEAYASSIHLPSSVLKSFIFTSSRNELIERIFGLSPAFYWQTVESQENVCEGKDSNLKLHTEVSVALGFETFFLDPLMTHYTLQLVLDSGLDVCGLRLLYPTQAFLTDSSAAEPSIQTTDETCHPVLAMAVRGPHSNLVLQDVTTSLHFVLPRKEDSASVTLLHRGNQRLAPLLSLQTASQVHRDLCLWFSGRLPGKHTQNDKQSLNRVTYAQNRDKGSAFKSSRSPSSLCATTKADLLLVVSPIVPPCCYSHVLAVCEHRGFSLMGLQRQQLQSKRASVLGFSNHQTPVFCCPNTTTQKQKEQDLSSHSLVLMLRKENAVHHSISLPSALMKQLKAENLLGCIHHTQDSISTVKADLCFHTVPYSSEQLFVFVQSMWMVPCPSHVILSRHKSLSTADMEQVVILTICEKDMSNGLSLLHRVLTRGFKLLGLKFLPVLTRPQALELTPYEVGEQLHNSSVATLMSSPVLVCALSQAEAFYSLRKLLPQDYPANLGVLMSATPEVAFRQASVIFLECEVTFGGLVEVCKTHNGRSHRKTS